MHKIYLIAGLGADTRLYNNIDLQDNDVTPVDWIVPNEYDSLATYAQKLIHQYYIEKNSVVIGVSLGGMIAVEIAKQVPLNKVILISSIKNISEISRYFRLFRTIPIYKLLSGRTLANLGFLVKPVFGKMNDQDAWLFNDMLKKSSPKFIKWAIGAVLKWDNKTIPANLYQIAGDKDLVFNYKNISNATIVKGGTHIMVFDKAKQINKLLKSILKKK